MIENNIISDHFTVEELKKLKITPPAAIASSVSALVMAGSFAKFLVPMRTFL